MVPLGLVMPKPTAVYASPSVTSASTRGMMGQTPVMGEESWRADMSWPQMLSPGTLTALTANQVTLSAEGKLLLLKAVAAAS